jgi:hypothetical protein
VRLSEATNVVINGPSTLQKATTPSSVNPMQHSSHTTVGSEQNTVDATRIVAKRALATFRLENKDADIVVADTKCCCEKKETAKKVDLAAPPKKKTDWVATSVGLLRKSIAGLVLGLHPVVANKAFRSIYCVRQPPGVRQGAAIGDAAPFVLATELSRECFGPDHVGVFILACFTVVISIFGFPTFVMVQLMRSAGLLCSPQCKNNGVGAVLSVDDEDENNDVAFFGPPPLPPSAASRRPSLAGEMQRTGVSWDLDDGAAAEAASLVVVGSPCIAGDAVRLKNPAARGEPEASGDEGDNDTTSETRTRRRRPHKRALTTAVILGRDSGDNDDETVVNSNDNDIFARNPTALGVVHAGLCFRCACIIAFLQRRRDAFDVAHDAKTEPERFQSTCSYRFDSISCLSSITLT